MNRINYADLQLRVDKSVSTFDFNGQTIEVLNYLPIEDKYDLVMVTLQKSEENGGYNPLKMDMYLHLLQEATRTGDYETFKELFIKRISIWWFWTNNIWNSLFDNFL